MRSANANRILDRNNGKGIEFQLLSCCTLFENESQSRRQDGFQRMAVLLAEPVWRGVTLWLKRKANLSYDERIEEAKYNINKQLDQELGLKKHILSPSGYRDEAISLVGIDEYNRLYQMMRREKMASLPWYKKILVQ